MSSNIYNLGRNTSSKQPGVDIPKKKKVTPVVPTREEVPVERLENPIQEIYEAAARAMVNIKVNPNDPSYEPFYVHPRMQHPDDGYVDYFKTIRIDNGQFERILLDENEQYETSFPAVFIRFTNIRYLVQQQRIGEGRGTMRIRFITNNLNHDDDIVETMPFRIMQLINLSIQNAKAYEPAFQERVNLEYNDMPERVNMLQAYWVDYEVWFKDTSTWAYNDYLSKYVVHAPFTNHSDAPEHNEDGHEDHKKPTYDDSSTIIGYSNTRKIKTKHNSK